MPPLLSPQSAPPSRHRLAEFHFVLISFCFLMIAASLHYALLFRILLPPRQVSMREGFRRSPSWRQGRRLRHSRYHGPAILPRLCSPSRCYPRWLRHFPPTLYRSSRHSMISLSFDFSSLAPQPIAAPVIFRLYRSIFSVDEQIHMIRLPQTHI